MCKATDDVQISTYGAWSYHWHGTCHYTVAQSLYPSNGDSYNPPFLIEAGFRKCSSSYNVTCINDVHYIDKQGVEVEISGQNQESIKVILFIISHSI